MPSYYPHQHNGYYSERPHYEDNSNAFQQHQQQANGNQTTQHGQMIPAYTPISVNLPPRQSQAPIVQPAYYENHAVTQPYGQINPQNYRYAQFELQQPAYQAQQFQPSQAYYQRTSQLPSSQIHHPPLHQQPSQPSQLSQQQSQQLQAQQLQSQQLQHQQQYLLQQQQQQQHQHRQSQQPLGQASQHKPYHSSQPTSQHPVVVPPTLPSSKPTQGAANTQNNAQPSAQKSRVLQDVHKNVARPQPPVPSKPEPVPNSEPDIDYSTVLLAMADEYLEVAFKLTVRSEEYFKIVATALGCIEAVLDNFKLPPLREAQVTLRYAQLLYSETDNNDDAERWLSKVVDLCGRLKFLDLKYASQLLQAKVLFRSRPKAALKDLLGVIQDAETYKHLAWEYALRMQYVMLLMMNGMPNDTRTALSQLERLAVVSRNNGDHAVYALSCILEALVHLQMSANDSVAASQQSLAKARALQLNNDVSDSPQMMVMLEFIDLAGQIRDLNITASEQKRKSMQQALYAAVEKTSLWRSDGLFSIPLSPSALRGVQTQEGGLVAKRDGRHFLSFSWLSKEEVEDLGYLFSGVSAAHKNAGDSGKAERFLSEGTDMLKEIMDGRKLVTSTDDALYVRRQLLMCHFHLELALLQCSKGAWEKARETANVISGIAIKLEDRFLSSLRCLLDYVDAVIYQGQGLLDQAYSLYQSLSLRLQDDAGSGTTGRPAPPDELQRNIAVLSAINTVFIIQRSSHLEHHRLNALLHMLDPIVQQTPNKAIQAAYSFLLASLPNQKILQTKQYLGNALNAAQGINNAQITTLCLVSMQEKFFKGVVGDQSIKCARAATHQAKRLGEPMWISVACGLESDCHDLHGMSVEAMNKSAEAQSLMAKLPAKVVQSSS